MKIAIIGGGPLGSYAGLKLVKEHDVTIYERRAKSGVKHSGLFSTNINKFYKPPKKVILNKIRGARFVSPSGKTVEIGNKKTRAVVTDTYKFDKSILNKAISSGVKIKRGVTADEITKKSGMVNIKAGQKIEKYDFLIGAEGPYSITARFIGVRNRQTLSGLETIAKYKNPSHDSVEMFFGKNVAPGFFAWTIPIGDGKAKVGLITRNPNLYFDKLLKNLNIKHHEEITGGIIPVGYYKDFCYDNICLIGDAAGHTKSTTGGGLITGFASVELLVKALSLGISKKDLQKNYYNPWSKTVGKELWLHYRIRKFLNKLNDEGYDNLINLMPEIKHTLENHGDMDYPTKFFKQILLNWKVIKFGLLNFTKIL